MILHVKPFLTAATDDTAETFGAPVEWDVYGLAPGSMEEPSAADRDLSVIAWTVLAPASDDVPNERDRVVVDGEDFEVVARPKDYTRGPFSGPAPWNGVTVELSRAEG